METRQLIVIVGPTASGKTDLAIRLAQALDTEIVSADSRQVFRELEIGTSKPTPEQLGMVPHHFINTRSIHEEYNAGQYGREALARIHHLFEKHSQVILCGGSGLYVKAVCEGFDEIPDVPREVRDKILHAYEEKGLAWLQQQVELNDPDYFSLVDQQNPQRLVRALELNYSTGRRVAEFRKKKKLQHPFSIKKIGLESARDVLYERIDSRMDQMIARGLFEEAKSLYSHKNLQALQTVGYQEIFGYLDGNYDRAEAIRLLKQNSRKYAKRQLTWFMKDEEIEWVTASQEDHLIQNLKFKIQN